KKQNWTVTWPWCEVPGSGAWCQGGARTMLAPKRSCFWLENAQVPGVSVSFVCKRTYVSKKKKLPILFLFVFIWKVCRPRSWHLASAVFGRFPSRCQDQTLAPSSPYGSTCDNRRNPLFTSLLGTFRTLRPG